jgi:hypothetical protein
VVAKIEWHQGELFPRIGFVVTNSRLPPSRVIKLYNGRGWVENRIKEGKNTLRWDKTICRRFEANQARLQMGVLAYNLLHMIRQFYVWGEEVKLSIDWLIKRMIKGGGQGFLPCTEVVSACGQRFPSISPLPGGFGLGLIGFPARWHLVAQGLVCPRSGKKLTFRPNLCNIFPLEKNWLREEDRLGEFTRPKRLQNLVRTEIAKHAA